MNISAKQLAITACLISLLIFIALAGKMLEKNANSKETRTTNEALPAVYGNPKAETIIEIIGYPGCQQCETQSINLRAVIDQNPNIQLHWYDLPNDSLDMSATQTTIATHCAEEQDQYWQYFDLINSQQQKNKTVYIEAAKTLELNEKKFTRCLEKQKPLKNIEQNSLYANEKNPTALPTTFIQQKRYTGVMSINEIQTALQN